jgi:hypothetical protein
MQYWQTPYLGEHLISWLLVLVSTPFCLLVLYKIRETNYEAEEVVTVGDTDLTHKEPTETSVKVDDDRRVD